MTSLILGIIYIISNSSLACIREAATSCYAFASLKGENSSEVKEMYGKLRRAYELEECFMALKEHQLRAQEGGDDILLLRKHILDQIHNLVE